MEESRRWEMGGRLREGRIVEREKIRVGKGMEGIRGRERKGREEKGKGGTKD